MTVILHMKIGTIPYGLMRVKYKHHRPKIGERVFVKPKGAGIGTKWMQVTIDKYNDDGYCFASR